jgi:hypothetical protein
MPGIKDELIAAKTTAMLSNDFSISNQSKAICGHPDRNDLACLNSEGAVVIAIQSDQAGAGNP